VPYNTAVYGGTPEANAFAAESTWPQMIAFINRAERHSVP